MRDSVYDKGVSSLDGHDTLFVSYTVRRAALGTHATTSCLKTLEGTLFTFKFTSSNGPCSTRTSFSAPLARACDTQSLSTSTLLACYHSLHVLCQVLNKFPWERARAMHAPIHNDFQSVSPRKVACNARNDPWSMFSIKLRWKRLESVMHSRRCKVGSCFV